MGDSYRKKQMNMKKNELFRIVNKHPNMTCVMLSKMLSVSPSTIGNWLKDKPREK